MKIINIKTLPSLLLALAPMFATAQNNINDDMGNTTTERVHVDPDIYGYSLHSNISGSLTDYQLSNPDEMYFNLFDGNNSTKWCIACNSWPITISKDIDNYHPFVTIGMDKAYVLTHYQLTEGGDTHEHPNRNWATWTVYGSNNYNDKNSWVKISEENDPTKTLFRTSNDNTATQYTSTYEVDNTKTAYQYYKFVVEDVVGAEGNNFYVMQMAGLDLYGYDPSVKVPGDISGDKTLDSTDIYNLKDMILGTKTSNDAADINQDGKKTITDLSTLIHIMIKAK